MTPTIQAYPMPELGTCPFLPDKETGNDPTHVNPGTASKGLNELPEKGCQ